MGSDIAANALRRRARLAYEGGRLGRSILSAWPVPPLVAAASWCCGSGSTTLALGLLLGAGLVLLRHRGRIEGRAGTAGLVAGLPPFLLPLALRSSGTACVGDLCLPACLLGCTAGGILAVLVLASATPRAAGETSRFLIAAGAVAALTGGLGCLVMGGPGLAAMGAGALLASPALLLSPGRGRP